MESIASTSTTSQKVTLQTADGQEFAIAHDIAKQSNTLRLMIDVDCTESLIPVPNITGEVMALVVDYCKKRLDVELPPDSDAPAAADDGAMTPWEAEFINQVGYPCIYDLVLAANYLDIKSLLSVSCQKVADDLKEKTPEEIRSIFNIRNDFSPEEEERVRRENQWAFQ